MKTKRKYQTWLSTLVCGLLFCNAMAGCFGGGGGGDDGGGSGNGGAVNTAPAPTAPAIETVEDTPGSSQISVNDPDTGQTHTFTIITPPGGGTATVDSAGLVTYIPEAGFTGMDSIVVEVADSGDPPRVGTVTINITVTSVEMPATADDLAERVFAFPDGGALDAGLTGVAVTLTVGAFSGNTGSFTLTTPDHTAGGMVTIDSCTFAVEFSTFPPGEGLQVGVQIVIDPCTIDPRDGHLILVNADTGAVSVSEPPEALPGSPGNGALIDEPFDYRGFRFDRHEVFVGDLNFCFLRLSVTEITGAFGGASCAYFGFDSAGQLIGTAFFSVLLNPNQTLVIEPQWAGAGTSAFLFECADIVALQFQGCSITR